MTQAEQVTMLRKLVEQVEAGEPLSTEAEQAILREVEDRIDLDAVRAARGEPRRPLDDVLTELGL